MTDEDLSVCLNCGAKQPNEPMSEESIRQVVELVEAAEQSAAAMKTMTTAQVFESMIRTAGNLRGS